MGEKKNGRALVTAMHGTALVLAWDGDEALQNMLDAAGVHVGGGDFAAGKAGMDYELDEDGTYVVDLVIEDDGEGDYPGTREYCVAMRNERPATKEEWNRHLDGEWPWEDVDDRCEVCGKQVGEHGT
jgi:hypothetical protein